MYVYHAIDARRAAKTKHKGEGLFLIFPKSRNATAGVFEGLQTKHGESTKNQVFISLDTAKRAKLRARQSKEEKNKLSGATYQKPL